MTAPRTANAPNVLVSDFDGTMTRHDFYRLAIEHLVPADSPNHWADYRAGAITHFEGLRRYFAAIRRPEAEVLEVVNRMGLDPRLAEGVRDLRAAGWDVVVTSAGCEWYIRRLLDAAGVELTVYANPGRFEPGHGLVMELPTDSPVFCPDVGIDKAAVVRRCLAEGKRVAFAGDGFPDEKPARLVPPALRFARGDLADVLTRAGEPFRPFATWSDIPRALLNREG